ncbi:MAG: tRNA (N(6)-L-threonylcarbamoyladenosine(37)-C(2))-methylthiotransferase MtaB [Deltaproteobacteria bacterium]|jgi:threonylcarbamoyladenosine tRNA methylthiotransferase MtaB|nr:tRNA (N(6)-L-threonylcarbamoyladenosine(37)-C(2))-methylthiotransferase MtaB [Deltaproteobacteria bacterium]
MKRVAISTLGCKTNQFESAAMIEQLKAAGYLVVPFTEPSDIYIVNSCTVTARTDAETRRLIRRAHRLNPASRIIATGCYAQVAPGELEKMPELDCVLGNQEKQNISDFLESATSSVSDIAAVSRAEPLKLTSFAEHIRAFLQIQNGCNSFCAYCIVPYARGRSRSVSPAEILQGVRDLAANSFKEIVLTGIHLGAYGLDLSSPTSLTALVREITAEYIVPRLRIGSVEPNEVSEELLGLMAQSKSICPHLHLPLQSGSDSVLKRMGRPYTSGEFRDLVTRISVAMPDAFIGADVIAGFPGETEEEFQDTVRLLEDLPFSDLHVFPYSSRPGTRAASMSGHLSPQTVTVRAASLRNIAKQKKEIFLQRFVDKDLKILIQRYDVTSGFCSGLSRNYISVSFPGEKALVNEEVSVRITRCNGAVCSGNTTAVSDR